MEQAPENATINQQAALQQELHDLHEHSMQITAGLEQRLAALERTINSPAGSTGRPLTPTPRLGNYYLDPGRSFLLSAFGAFAYFFNLGRQSGTVHGFVLDVAIGAGVMLILLLVARPLYTAASKADNALNTGT